MLLILHTQLCVCKVCVPRHCGHGETMNCDTCYCQCGDEYRCQECECLYGLIQDADDLDGTEVDAERAEKVNFAAYRAEIELESRRYNAGRNAT